MSIWLEDITLDNIATRSHNTLAEHLNIEFHQIGKDYLSATMPVDHRTQQPLGILNGGASCALAETVASTAANYCVNQSTHYCVGQSITANHVRPASSGYVTGTARPLHIGKRTQVWNVDICNEKEQLICSCRMTMAVIER